MAGWALFGLAPQVSASENNVTVQESYLGRLEYQGQSITKKTAELLHRQILLQRATQLVSWAMPMMNFYQLYPAMLSNQKMSENDVFFSLCDGYDGVYPYMTANVTTPYTIAMSDLSKTGPVVVDLPARSDLRRGQQCLDAAHPRDQRQTGKTVAGGARTSKRPRTSRARLSSPTPFWCSISTGRSAPEMRRKS